MLSGKKNSQMSHTVGFNLCDILEMTELENRWVVAKCWGKAAKEGEVGMPVEEQLKQSM